MCIVLLAVCIVKRIGFLIAKVNDPVSSFLDSIPNVRYKIFVFFLNLKSNRLSVEWYLYEKK